MNTHNDDAEAIRNYHRRQATQEFGEVIRSNTRGWDDPPMNDDQQAYSDYAIRKAAEKFYEETRHDYDWPER